MDPPEIDRSSRRIASWDRDLVQDGQVIFRQDKSELRGVVLLVFFALGAGLVLSILTRAGEPMEDAGAVFGWTALFLAAIFIPFAVLMMRYEGKTLVVKTEGIQVENGDLVPWSGLVSAEAQQVGHNRAVVLKVTPEFMGSEYRRKPWYSRLNMALTFKAMRGPSLILSYAMQADDEEFARWITMRIANPPDPPVLKSIWYEKDLERMKAASP